MCGICGKLLFDSDATVVPEVFAAMPETLSHRGPDDQGIYTSTQVAFGHRRLSIIGLSTGHQPLSNEDGTVWITFNGEIYNYRDLRRDLLAKGHRFATETDTEVIVHLYEEFGERCVEKLRGMFAFGLWDERKRCLLLARDRLGIKPLYYYRNRKGLVFASEMKALLADADTEVALDPAMIDRFLTFYYMPGEETLIRGIRKLEPGCYMVVQDGREKITRYWDLEFQTSNLTLKDAETRLLELLEESVRLHLISDVPVGVLLSGGFDSTAILSLIRQQSDHPISTYTVGFEDPSVTDERPFARLAAKQFGTDHHEMTITARDFEAFLPRYVWHMEEPVCEPPAVALFYVSALASNYVKVLLSGEGGDEAFAGYSNYRNMLWLERAKRLGGLLSGPLSRSSAAIDRLAGSGRGTKYAQLMRTSFSDYYRSRTSSPFTYFNSQWEKVYTPEFAQITNKAASCSPVSKLFGTAPKDLVNRMLYIDTKTWLPDDLLIKADKMTMASSVELRVPLLDHKVLEFAASLPGHYKVRGITTKYLAKKALNKFVPPQITKRKKTGFPVPYPSWLRGEMHGWLCDLLLDSRSLTRQYVKKSSMEQLISEDLRSRLYAKELFSLATLELWQRTFLPPRCAPADRPVPQVALVGAPV